ncbi:MAG: membrane protein insertion efficiency factor YidD [Defluviitaleaceae bacterium]|nr:membrane protein insertion efficiency factor YidD [Defluviitaleaceae bacterium]
MKIVALLLIRFYQAAISPHFLPRCRYIPSCSAYAYEAFSVHGFFVGGFLAVWRILRCHPFCVGGVDPVPPKGFYKQGLW